MADRDELKRDTVLLEERLLSLAERNQQLVYKLRRCRESNTKYFIEFRKLLARDRPQLVILDAGEYMDTQGVMRHAWSVWLDGVRLYTTSCVADNADQPERLWQTREALENALGVKAMRAKAKHFDARNVGGYGRKITPTWTATGNHD